MKGQTNGKVKRMEGQTNGSSNEWEVKRMEGETNGRSNVRRSNIGAPFTLTSFTVSNFILTIYNVVDIYFLSRIYLVTL